MATISVIMPAWRSVATIGRALASVAVQTVLPAEIIVCDDGSDDGTAAEAATWQARLNGCRLVILTQANAGAGAARNRCLAEASGDLVAFLDADDEWLPTKLERSLAALRPADAFVSHDMMIGDRVIDCARHFRTARDPFAALFLRGFVATSTVVARRGAVMAVGGFDPSIAAGQDYDLWLTLAAKEPFTVFGEALTRYHVTPGSITSRIEARRQGSLRILHRHAGRLRGRGVSPRLQAVKRALIVQAEAALAWHGRRQWGRVLTTMLATPLVLAAIAAHPVAEDPRAMGWST